MKEFQDFMNTKKENAELTKKSYSIIVSKFLKAMNIETIEDLKLIQANQLQSYINGLDVSPTTKNGVIRVLKVFYGFLFEWDYIQVNPMLRIKKQKTGQKVIKMPTEKEMEVIYSNCENKTTSLIINLASRVGLRRDEICKIKLSDINEEGRIKVNGKGNKERTLKLPESIFAQIKNYIQHKNRKESDFLFSYDGHSVSTTSINMRVTEYINSLDFSEERKEVLRRVHGYRHRCATNVYNVTKDPYAVKHQLGHSDISIGQIYIHAEETSYDSISGAL